MPRGDKSSYPGRQQRMAEHIEKGYENRGVSEGEAERRAWATVNKELTEGRRAVRAAVKLKTTPPPALVESLEVGVCSPSSGGAFRICEEGCPHP